MTYTDSNRGMTQYPERMKQPVLFEGLRFGNATPTDIDGFFEIHGETFVFFEVKLEGAVLPKGQSLALTRLVDYLTIAGRDAVLFICTHNETDPHSPIVAKNLSVQKAYYKGKLYDYRYRTLKDAVESFVAYSQKNHEL